MNLIKSNLDFLGAGAGFLCAVHCMATPFIFVAQVCTESCCADTPLYWRLIDFIFLIISFYAIKHTIKTSSNRNMKYYLWIAWGILSASVIIEHILLIESIVRLKYISAFTLIGLHIYNRKYFRCEQNCCETEIS